MKFQDTHLPWNNARVGSTGELYPYLNEKLPDQHHYLPLSVTLFSDPEIEESAVLHFLEELPFQLEREIRLRNTRRERFVSLGLLSDREIHRILTGHRHVQPWALYYSKDGGLDLLAPDSYGEDSSWGAVPCTSMLNHGVAWRKTPANHSQIWLATARKKAHDWDWDSDIGHESAHSSFAPIPLFAQALLRTETTPLDSVSSIQELNSSHLARMSYIYSEIAVIAMRGEQRNTDTGLPVVERPEELYAFLEFSHELMPDFGFERALAACKRVSGHIDVNDSIEIFELGVPVMRVLPQISQVIDSFGTPTIDWYKLNSALTE
ncbi:hypothetical protein [Scytonema sp. PCC 10023]|uniref:hypothetical protein n=1 Tax=Scytonema sp. PCC 10023 TaxID=1680591 RepID=UPI0039C69B0E